MPPSGASPGDADFLRPHYPRLHPGPWKRRIQGRDRARPHAANPLPHRPYGSIRVKNRNAPSWIRMMTALLTGSPVPLKRIVPVIPA